jgi:hypothetical protein
VNIREMIEQLTATADGLPEGLDTPVRVHICNGHDAPSVNTAVADILPEQEMDVKTMRVRPGSTRVVVTVHPHSDDTSTTSRPVTMDVDDELARLVAGDVERLRPAAQLPPGTRAVTYGGMRIPFSEAGQPITPGSDEAITFGCLCDPVKNNRGRGADSDGEGIRFVQNKACPVHRPQPGDREFRSRE